VKTDVTLTGAWFWRILGAPQGCSIGFIRILQKLLFCWVSVFFRQLAEREGFEPPIRLPVRRISSAVLSTTQPPLRRVKTALGLRRVCSRAAPKRQGRRSLALRVGLTTGKSQIMPFRSRLISLRKPTSSAPPGNSGRPRRGIRLAGSRVPCGRYWCRAPARRLYKRRGGGSCLHGPCRNRSRSPVVPAG
jgi:hypothetical protein